MRDMKTSGGLIRGRGMSESQRAQWLLLQGTSIPDVVPGHFVEYVADNADHNINTFTS